MQILLYTVFMGDIIQIYAGLNSDADIGMLVKLSFNAEYTESIGLNN